jgi:hypothetical protein
MPILYAEGIDKVIWIYCPECGAIEKWVNSLKSG